MNKLETREELFLKECLKTPPDYKKLQAMLRDGVNINAEMSDDNEDVSILANVIMDFGSIAHCEVDGNCEKWNRDKECDKCEHYKPERIDTGKELFKLVRFFIKNGFDVKKYGDECLANLCWSTGNTWILRIAEELIDNGAPVKDYDEEYDEDDAFGTINWKLGDWMTGAYTNANLMSAYCMLVYNAGKGKDYHGIRAFQECIGHKVRKVEKLIHENTPKEVRDNNCYNDSLIIWCDDLPLYVHKCPELYVNSLAKEEALETIDVSSDYDQILGLSVKEVTFIDSTTALLRFHASDKELLLYYISRPEKEDSYMFARIVDDDCCCSLPDKVDALYFKPGFTYSDQVRVFGEERIVVECSNSYYLLFSEGAVNQNHRIRSLKVDSRICQGEMRLADLNQATDGHSFYDKDGLLVALSYKLDSYFLHIVADKGDDLNICLSDHDVDGKSAYYSFNEDFTGFGFKNVLISNR